LLILSVCIVFFFLYATASTSLYTLSLHDALPISAARPLSAAPTLGGCGPPAPPRSPPACSSPSPRPPARPPSRCDPAIPSSSPRSEEHTSELQSLAYLVCRLLLEKKKKTQTHEHK